MASKAIRTTRIDDEPWEAAKARAALEGSQLTTLMREWVEDYAAGKPRFGPGRPNTVEISRAELTKLRELVDRILQ